MPRTYPKTSQLTQENALLAIGTTGETPINTIVDYIEQNTRHPIRVYAANTPDAKLYFSANIVKSSNGTDRITKFAEDYSINFVDNWIDFQTQTTNNAAIAITFPASTVGYFRRCVFWTLRNGTIAAVFTPEEPLEANLASPLSTYVTGGVLFSCIELQCTDIAGKFKTLGSATSVIENSVGGISRIHQIYDTASPTDHLLLTNINGGVFGDGGHDNLVQLAISTATPNTNSDIDAYKNGSLWLNTNTKEIYLCTDNTNAAAVWKQVAFNGGNFVAASLILGTTSGMPFIFKCGNTEMARMTPSIGVNFSIGTSNTYSMLTVDGGISTPVTSIMSPITAFSLTKGHTLIQVDAANLNDVSINLLSASTLKGMEVIIKKLNPNDYKVTVTSGSDTIEGLSSFTFTSQNETYRFKADGSTNWRVI